MGKGTKRPLSRADGNSREDPRAPSKALKRDEAEPVGAYDHICSYLKIGANLETRVVGEHGNNEVVFVEYVLFIHRRQGLVADMLKPNRPPERGRDRLLVQTSGSPLWQRYEGRGETVRSNILPDCSRTFRRIRHQLSEHA